MVKSRLYTKSLEVTMKEHHFDGTDPIRVVHFLIHFVTEADKLNISEGQACIPIHTYLTGRANTQLTFMQLEIRAGGVT